jgi:hypothetical protein
MMRCILKPARRIMSVGFRVRRSHARGRPIGSPGRRGGLLRPVA